ncbi:putative Transposable element Tc1 transposase-like 54 [Homarus americanus]|uniref:Putative Transposable element Tc1 transposase-like 54 n=1 Tax=Homarus americanus TaxID=6706 RepID=A0A8J5N7E0_HOMAM|nr:putative Transposable element Tc1 transposase-like 54 [Homarus americanus]
MSKSTVTKCINQCCEEAGMTSKRPSSFKTLICFPPSLDQAILSIIDTDPLATAVSIQDDLGLQCPPQTIRSRLHSMDLHSYTPAKKLHLSELNRENRMECSLQYCYKDDSFWDHVVFCDEKTFSSDNHRNTKVWRI